jgi:predicted HicB family RNase H-like nuclease
MGRVIQVRFNPEDSRKIADAAKAGKQTVSEWVRSTIHATLNA